MNRIRCFVSVDVEDHSLVSRIVSIQNQLKSTGARIKLVEPQNLHLTLRFIGEVPRELVDAIARALSEVDFEKFTIRLAGLDAFPNPRRPRVVWIGVDKGADKLVELSDNVNKVLSRLGLPKPREEFVPHLTIARVKGGVGSLPSALAKLVNVEIGSMEVCSFRLKKSTLTPRGPIYETLFEKKARG